MRLVRQITYEAESDAEALAIARDRLGRDAVILSSRIETRGGMLGLFRKKALVVTAGLLEDDKEQESEETSSERIRAFQRLLEVKQAMRDAFPEVPPAPSAGREGVPEAASSLNATAPEGVSVAISEKARQLMAQKEFAALPKAPQEEPNNHMREEIDEIRGLLNDLLGRFPAPPLEEEQEPEGAPEFQVLEKEMMPPVDVFPPEEMLETKRPEEKLIAPLLEQDVDTPLAQGLLDGYLHSQGACSFPDWLSSRIPVMGGSIYEALGGRKALFVGPTGVGKTTTIAKLAAILSLWEKKKVFLLTADTYRIAAVEQLKMYARILGVPFGVLQNPGEVEELLESQRDIDVVLIDTAGRCQRDEEKMEELEMLYNALQPDVVHLVLAANMKSRDMTDVLQRMNVPLSGMVFTKLDETLSYGPLLEVLLKTGLPMSFITAGQNVPNDIDIADAKFLVELLMGREDNVSVSQKL